MRIHINMKIGLIFYYIYFNRKTMMIQNYKNICQGYKHGKSTLRITFWKDYNNNLSTIYPNNDPKKLYSL